MRDRTFPTLLTERADDEREASFILDTPEVKHHVIRGRRRLNINLREMLVDREGELHRFDANLIAKEILESLRSGASIRHAVDTHTIGMSTAQIALVMDTFINLAVATSTFK